MQIDGLRNVVAADTHGRRGSPLARACQWNVFQKLHIDEPALDRIDDGIEQFCQIDT